MAQARTDLRSRQRATFQKFTKDERRELARLLSRLASLIDEVADTQSS